MLQMLNTFSLLITIMSQWRQLDKRPTGITIVAYLQIIAGIFTIIGGVIFASTIGFAWFLVGILYMVLGGFYMYVALGLSKGKGWAWISMIIVQIVGIPLNLILLFIGATGGGPGLGLVGVPLGIAIVVYMLKPTTRAYFGKARV
jgi:hypothetical protein